MLPRYSRDGKIVMPKIVLFYLFTPITDPDAVRLWQRELCARLELTGRIVISAHGINGTVGGALVDLKQYVRRTREFAAFKGVDFKWSEGRGGDFPRLSVKVRDEIVTFGVPDEIDVSESGIVGGGQHLSPDELHNLVAERPDEVVFLDGRNALEAEVGKFKNAVIADVQTTRDFIDELDSGKYDDLKGRPIVTYCTGGIRCEVLSALMVRRGFGEVYQLEGGIARYGEKFKDDGLWEGSLYVFDKRMTVDFSDTAKVIGQCGVCAAPAKTFLDCARPGCDRLEVICNECAELSPLCTEHRTSVHHGATTSKS